MKTRKFTVPRNLVAKHAHKTSRAQVHESKKVKDLQYWRNQPKSSLNELI